MDRLICMAILDKGLMAFRDVGGAKERSGLTCVDMRCLVDRSASF